MQVTEADYRSFYRDMRRQRYLDEESARNGAFSYDTLDGEDFIVDSLPLLDEVVPDKLLLEQMLLCFGLLAEGDRVLLTALYFEGQSEDAVSRALGVTQQTVNKWRKRAIRRLKKLMRI
ncbi:MAG: helix-turn-helix domain-containing protein [Firmicutes bacterium]|nr:helix-turn-helix domain-containing protein [Bacillota bacterium]